MTEDPKLAISLAHLRLPVTRLADAVAFFESIGARPDTRRDKFAVVELHDGTRLQLTESEEPVPSDRELQFDFKVEDIDTVWGDYQAKGLNPSEIVRRRPGHDSFVVVGPDSCEIKINSGFKRG